MNSEKFKEWLIKIDSANLQKPVEQARLHQLNCQIQELSIQVHHILKEKDTSMRRTEEEINEKTSELFMLQNKAKDNYHRMRAKIAKQRDFREAQMRNDIKIVEEMCAEFARKANNLSDDLNRKNTGYLQVLGSQLQALKQVRKSTSSRRQEKYRNYQRWVQESSKSADLIIERQEKDLIKIHEYQKELNARCDMLEGELHEKIENQIVASGHKQKLLLQKLEMLIANIYVD